MCPWSSPPSSRIGPTGNPRVYRTCPWSQPPLSDPSYQGSRSLSYVTVVITLYPIWLGVRRPVKGTGDRRHFRHPIPSTPTWLIDRGPTTRTYNRRHLSLPTRNPRDYRTYTIGQESGGLPCVSTHLRGNDLPRPNNTYKRHGPSTESSKPLMYESEGNRNPIGESTRPNGKETPHTRSHDLCTDVVTQVNHNITTSGTPSTPPYNHVEVPLPLRPR